MTRFVKATYHTAAKAAEYIAEDGRHLIRTGGSLQWRLCNCGNLVSPMSNGVPSPKKTKGYIGFAKAGTSGHHFFIFPDYETGRNELKASLRRKYNEKTLSETMKLYAPPDDNNDTDRYINQLSQISGVGKDEKLKDLDDARLNKMIDGIQRLEGYDANADTRKEQWVNVSHIQATNGTRPVANEEIVVKNGATTTTLKSNAAGRFPPIVHGKEPVQVQHKTAEGKLKPVGELPPDRGVFMNLLTKVEEYFGTSTPVKPPPKPVKAKQPITYVVQPGDILGRLAVRFSTTVAEIQRDNGLKTTMIMPGQALRIHAGATAAAPPPDAPKKALPKPAAPPAKPATAPPKPAAAPAKKPAAAPKAARVPPPQAQTAPARSKEGAGEALALITPEEGVAPWMKHALAEAKKHKGADEGVIEKDTNYHTDIKDGRASLVGTLNAWCAAFVNWSLVKAGYPIQNPKESGFVDRVAATARAHGFIDLRGKKTEKGQKYENVPMVDNPLFYKIEEPVYGAIAIVVGGNGHGHHAGFVYAKESEANMILLGGNQGQTIKFSPFNTKVIPSKTVGTGKNKRVTKGNKEHLVFLLPASYTNPKENGPDKLETRTVAELNKLIGIEPPKKKPAAAESTR